MTKLRCATMAPWPDFKVTSEVNDLKARQLGKDFISLTMSCGHGIDIQRKNKGKRPAKPRQQ